VRFPAWVGKEHLSRTPVPTAINPGERQLRDLYWMMLNTVGVPNLTKFGAATAPLDLS
jgi:hypothetical protein